MTDPNNKYDIITNQSFHRILVIYQVVNVDEEEELAFEDFDAVFINVADPVMDRNMLAIRLASPLHSEKCRFKPCFVTQRLKSWAAHTTDIIVDGYCSDPNDSLVAQTIDKIYANMRRYNFLLGTEPIVTHAQEIFRLCRYAISRGQFTFSSQPTPGLSSGYMALYYHTLWNEEHELLQAEEREYFHQQLLELGYIRHKRFIDKIHICPVCRRSHLLFFETCPKCSSSNLREEAVIHHFRCANVAPASDYEWDGELRCPKCKRMLLHIGVDYDKPSSVYMCGNCNNSFMYPEMRVLCSSCRRTFTPSDLLPLDVEEYEFTPDGIRALASNDINTYVSQVGFYGHSSMRDFEDYMRKFSESGNKKEVLLVSHFHLYDSDLLMPLPGESTPRLVKWMHRLYNYKSAISGNEYFFLCRVEPGQVTQRQVAMEYELKAEFADYAQRHSDFMYNLTGTFIYHAGEDIERFIQRIKENDASGL